LIITLRPLPLGKIIARRHVKIKSNIVLESDITKLKVIEKLLLILIIPIRIIRDIRRRLMLNVLFNNKVKSAIKRYARRR
jgi:hypothetical protein